MGLLCLNICDKIIIGREKVGTNYIPIINKWKTDKIEDFKKKVEILEQMLNRDN